MLFKIETLQHGIRNCIVVAKLCDCDLAATAVADARIAGVNRPELLQKGEFTHVINFAGLLTITGDVCTMSWACIVYSPHPSHPLPIPTSSPPLISPCSISIFCSTEAFYHASVNDAMTVFRSLSVRPKGDTDSEGG